MTALLVIGGVLGAVALVMFFIKRQEEKNAEANAQKLIAKNANKAISAPSGAGHELTKLKVDDAVSITGDTYTVKQKLIFREGNFEWVEYKLTDGSVVRWLEVEDDDELWLALYEEVDDLKLPATDRLPDELEYRGMEYELDEKGYASMRKAGEPVRDDLPQCRYYDYEGEGDAVLSVEQWGENFEVSVGARLSPHAIEVFGG